MRVVELSLPVDAGEIVNAVSFEDDEDDVEEDVLVSVEVLFVPLLLELESKAI
jgi:hypothetical protein